MKRENDDLSEVCMVDGQSAYCMFASWMAMIGSNLRDDTRRQVVGGDTETGWSSTCTPPACTTLGSRG